MSELRYHDNCSNLSIYNFDKISKLNEYAYILYDYDGFEIPKEFDLKKSKKNWSVIFNEYLELTNDSKTTLYYSTLSQLNFLLNRQHVVSLLIDRMINHNLGKKMCYKYIDALKEWGYNIDKSKPLAGELEKMLGQLKRSENKISIKKAELKSYSSENSEEISLIKQVVKIEQALKRNLIDPKKTSVEKWVMMLDEVNSRNKNGK